MELGLKGRRAIVLAASDGLGKAVARGLVQEGVDVAVCSRDIHRIEKAAKELRQAGTGRVLCYQCDVAQGQSLKAFVESAAADLDGLDILVTSSGGPPSGAFTALTQSAWQDAFDLVLMSAIHAIGSALPALARSDQPRIISIVSSSVRQPIPNLILSNVFRPAVAGLIKSLATELAGDGILVNAVAPGRIDTARVRGLDQTRAANRDVAVEQIRLETAASIPVGRYGEPEELANMVVFLASAAASYLTGGVYLVDGGMVKCLP